jgi:hypothetical protein
LRQEWREREEIYRRSIARECNSSLSTFSPLSLSDSVAHREQKAHECKEAKTEIPEEFLSSEDKAKKEELNTLALALEEVKDLVQHNMDSLQSVSCPPISLSFVFADVCLMSAIGECGWTDACD